MGTHLFRQAPLGLRIPSSLQISPTPSLQGILTNTAALGGAANPLGTAPLYRLERDAVKYSGCQEGVQNNGRKNHPD